MTEIVKNNSSIKLDILDMGNVGSDQSESEGVFNSLFGGINAKDSAEVLSTNVNIDDIDHSTNLYSIPVKIYQSFLKIRILVELQKEPIRESTL